MRESVQQHDMECDKKEQWIRVQSMLAHRGYTCLKLAGQGAFSRVYCLEDGKDGRIYACKVSPDTVRLEQEARMMEKLRHPLFAKYYGMWQETGKGFLLMEYVTGSNVKEMLKRRRHFSVEQALYMGMELAEGLRTLHEGGEALVFRDVKPENMIIGQNGMVKLIDFGCVCAMGKRAASRAGTPGFAAPEQMQEEGILTAACDVYGWGQTMKALLGAEENYVISGQENRQRRTMRKQLYRILEACTKRKASERIPDMRGVMAALMPFMPLYAEKRSRRVDRKSLHFQKGMVCEKNIILLADWLYR